MTLNRQFSLKLHFDMRNLDREKRPDELYDIVKGAIDSGALTSINEGVISELRGILGEDPRLKEMKLVEIEPPLPNGSSEAVLIHWTDVLNWERYVDENRDGFVRGDGFRNEESRVWLFAGGDEENLMTEVDDDELKVLGGFDPEGGLSELDEAQFFYGEGLYNIHFVNPPVRTEVKPTAVLRGN